MKKFPWMRMLGTFILTIVIVMAIYVLTKGWPLMFLPKIENIEKVIIMNTENGIEKEFTDDENIELAVKLINFLNYVPFSTVPDLSEPLISITYFLKDGTEINISANNTQVYLNGKVHQLKKAEIFVNLTNGVFFGEENAVKNGGTRPIKGQRTAV